MTEQLDDEASAVAPETRGIPFDVHVDRHRVANVSSDVVSCGAAGINVLVGAVRPLGDRGRLVIYDPSPMVARLIDITDLEALVEIIVGRVVNAAHPPRTNGARLGSARRIVAAGCGTQTDGCRMTTAEAR
jgi:hypothetical protein